MIRYTLKFGIMVILLLFGILLGMSMAEKGLYTVTGNPDADIQSFRVAQNENQVEVKVLGNSYVSEVPKKVTITNEAKVTSNEKDDNKNINEISFVSNLGNKLGEMFQVGAEKGLTLIVKIIE